LSHTLSQKIADLMAARLVLFHLYSLRDYLAKPSFH